MMSLIITFIMYNIALANVAVSVASHLASYSPSLSLQINFPLFVKFVLQLFIILPSTQKIVYTK